LSQGPPALCGHSLFWSAGYLTLYGGDNDFENLNRRAYGWAENYGWSIELPSYYTMPRAREFHAADFSGDYVWIFGGYDYGYTYSNDTWIFEAGPRKVTQLLLMANGSQLLLYGGRTEGVKTVFNDTWVWWKGMAVAGPGWRTSRRKVWNVLV
jgi:hypothetical protein